MEEEEEEEDLEIAAQCTVHSRGIGTQNNSQVCGVCPHHERGRLETVSSPRGLCPSWVLTEGKRIPPPALPRM